MATELISGQVVYEGYVPNPPHAEALAERCAPRWAADVAALAAGDDGGDRYNYRLLVACLQAAGIGKWLVEDGAHVRLNTYNQGNTSSCTGNARSMQLAVELAAQILAGAPKEFVAMPEPAIQYGLALEIDGSLGSDYGASGSAAVEASERFGSGYQLSIAGEDFSAGNAHGEDIAAWAARMRQIARRGVPVGVKAWIQTHRSAAHSRIETTDQAWAALGAAYPILLASTVSYDGKRNEEGVIRRTGSAWAHAMVCTSRRTSAKYGRLFLVHNSWTPHWTSGPYWLDQPVGSFWITDEDLAAMLVCQWSRRVVVRDCWISTGAAGFARRAEHLPTWATVRRGPR